MPFLRRSCVFFSISLLFIVVFVIFSIYKGVAVRASPVLLFSMIIQYDLVLRALLHGSECMLFYWLWLCCVCPCICVVDFSCSACFFSLYSALVLVFRLSFSVIRRSVVVFTRLYVARVSFICAMRVFRVLLLLCCVSLVPFVIFAILLPFASLDDYSQSVWMRLLRVVWFLFGVCILWFRLFFSFFLPLYLFLFNWLSLFWRVCVVCACFRWLFGCLNTIFYFVKMSPQTTTTTPKAKKHQGRSRVPSSLYGIGYRV